MSAWAGFSAVFALQFAALGQHCASPEYVELCTANGVERRPVKDDEHNGVSALAPCHAVTSERRRLGLPDDLPDDEPDGDGA